NDLCVLELRFKIRKCFFVVFCYFSLSLPKAKQEGMSFDYGEQKQ
ncbi:unnamed protein product, partial [Gulo gulo]